MILPWNLAAERRAAALRRRQMITAGHSGRVDQARQGLGDPDPDVQAAALGALARLGALTVSDLARALAAGPAALRRRATDAALSVRGRGSRSTLYTAPRGEPRPTPTRWSWSGRRGSSPNGGWPRAVAALVTHRPRP